jgi:sialic acid synthase SpsE
VNKIKIAENRYIGENEPCFIIAEAGINHNGDILIAKKMIDKANFKNLKLKNLSQIKMRLIPIIPKEKKLQNLCTKCLKDMSSLKSNGFKL